MMIFELVTDPIIRPVAIGTGAIGAVSGAVGTFAVIRRQSLQGDAVSHAALPGLALAYLFGARSDLLLVLGAAVTGWIALVCVSGIVRGSRVPFDSALAGALSVFFGLGLVVMTYLRQTAGGGTARLQQYLFGQDAALIRTDDLYGLLGLGGLAIAVMFLFWKEFKILSFDPAFAASLGFPSRWLDSLLTIVIVIAVVIGLQTVGVVLMSALMIAPAVGARQWSNRLSRVVGLAALFGMLSGFAGTLFSHWLSQLGKTVPTGPTIVLVATTVTVVSLVIAPKRGLLWRLVRKRNLQPPPELRA